MLVITMQTLKEHETHLMQGKLFPTAANETIKILKSYKLNRCRIVDEEAKKHLDYLLNKYGEQDFSMVEE